MQKIFLLGLLAPQLLLANPTSLFWTNCSTAICQPRKGFFEIERYQKVVKRSGHGRAVPTDYAVTYGIGSYNGVSLEAGLDILASYDPVPLLNTKAAISENYFFCGAPSFSLGIFNVGVKTKGPDATNQNVINLVAGKDLSWNLIDTVYAAAYKGNRAMGKNRVGSMFGVVKNFLPVKTQKGKEFYRITFQADFATGKNSVGGGGFGITYNITKDLFIQTGPVWFSDRELYGRWKWLFLIHLNLP